MKNRYSDKSKMGRDCQGWQDCEGTLDHLQDLFREWCGLLSVDELVENEPLTAVIERLSRMLEAA
ncbi:hypothetical protein WDW86_05000 [Bdellovibrionota bacterium FG-2]